MKSSMIGLGLRLPSCQRQNGVALTNLVLRDFPLERVRGGNTDYCLAQLEERRSAEQEVASSNPDRIQDP